MSLLPNFNTRISNPITKIRPQSPFVSSMLLDIESNTLLFSRTFTGTASDHMIHKITPGTTSATKPKPAPRLTRKEIPITPTNLIL